MQWFFDLLKSRGKAGGIGGIALGGYILFESFFGTAMTPEIKAIAVGLGLKAIFDGLSLFGIRVNQDK